MLPLVPSRAARSIRALSLHPRRLATQVLAPTSTPATTTDSGTSDSVEVDTLPIRPHLGIKANRNHGLYAFFRKKEKDGKVSYETVEPVDLVADKSGRAWTAAELRRKSFKDLHTLWYVVLRERNLLATQQAEARRIGVHEQTLGLWAKAFRCRKTMARIKYVINERRLAYEGALKIHATQHEVALKARVNEEQPPVKEAVEEKETRRERSPKDIVADIAAQSLFETVPAGRRA